MFDLKNALRLCLVIGFTDIGEEKMLQIIREAINGGITSLQLREKQADEKNIVRVGKLLLKLLPSHIPLIINDHVAVAHYLQTAVHIGQSDMQYQLVRKKLGPKAIIGLSIENISQAQHCQNLDVDYYGIGPIFSTPSKVDAATPIGIIELTNIQQLLTPKPCIAIGGININNIVDIKNTGVNGVAVISAITQAADSCLATQQLRTNWK